MSHHIRTLTLAARNGVPLVVRAVAPSGRALTLRDVLVAEVALDHAIVRTRRDGRRVVVRFDGLRSIERLDGRPWAPKLRPEPVDGRASLAARADEHESNGGLEP